MEHVGIDLGGKESQVCRRSADGTILEEVRLLTSRLPSYVRTLAPCRVILETCAEAFWVADVAKEAGHDVRVVPAAQVRALGVGARGLKTDLRDARALSLASCRVDLPGVHVRSALARERAAACGLRQALVRSRVQLVNAVRGQARTRPDPLPRANPESFPQRVRGHLEKTQKEVSPDVERVLRAVETLNEQIREGDRALKERAEADETCRRLMSIPGVGPVTALRFSAVVDEVSRFGGAHAVEAYLGLTPGERSSGSRRRRTGITKAGPAELRWTLVQAAWSLARSKPQDPMTRWARGIAERRGWKIAITALARKLAGVLFALWRDGSVYKPRPAPELDKEVETNLLPPLP